MIHARRSLALWVIVVSALDAWTTYVALRAGTGRELNPIAAEAIETFGLAGPLIARALLGVVGAVALLWLIRKARHERAQHVTAWVFAVILASWWSFIAVQNLQYV